MAKLKHSLRSYFKTPIFSLEKNFICFSGNLYRKKTIIDIGILGPYQIQKFIQSINKYFGRFAMSKHYQYHLHRRAEQLKHAQPIIERRWSSVQHAILSRNTFQ